MFNFFIQKLLNNKIQLEIDKKQEELNTINLQLQIYKKELDETINLLGTNKGLIELQDIGIEYIPEITSFVEINTKIDQIKKEMAQLISRNALYIIIKEYKVDHSLAKGILFQHSYCESLLFGFNSFFDRKKKNVTSQNLSRSIDLITNNFNRCNKKASIIGVKINEEYLHLSIRLLKLELDKKIAQINEKEEAKKARFKLREQEKLLFEADKEKKRLEKERKDLEKILSQSITKEDQEQIKNKLAEIDKRQNEIDWRINHSLAGWLYIATTKSMPGMYKIGCTRRLNPLIRLSELSSASVPFVFECNGLVFSENVFDIETKIHQRLDSKRVNKENKHKEFFYGNPNDAITILKEEFDIKVHYVNEIGINIEE